MSRPRRGRVWAVVALLLLLAALPASAHAQLIATTPGIGVELDAVPTSVTLTFDEAVTPGSIRVSSEGRRLDSGTPFHPGGNDHAVAVAVANGPATASYAVTWRVGSADGHAVDGAFSFGVGEPAGPAPPLASVSGSRAVTVLDDVTQALAYAGMVLGFGAALCLGLLWPGAADVRLRKLVAAGWALSIAAAAVLFLLRGPVTAGTGLGTLADGLGATAGTRSGRLLLARLVIVALALPALRRTLAAAARRAQAEPAVAARAVDLGVLAVLAAATFPLGDHAGTGSHASLAVALGTLHVLAATVWLGGLAVLVARPQPELRAWSRVAVACVGALVVTGVLATLREGGGWEALTHTRYGGVLLVKLLVVAGLLAVANAVRTRTPLPRVGVAAEAAVGACVLAVTAVLVATPPATSAYPAPRTFDVDLGGGLHAHVELDRSRIGPETFTVEVNGSFATLDGILSDKTYEDDPVRFPFVKGAPGHATGTAEVPETGSWRLDLELRGGPHGDAAGTLSYAVT